VWSDKETHLDCLGYTTYVEVLANICTHKDLAPLTLGIFGPWGSGKTSLMEMLRRHIESTKGEKKRKTLWFNAWMYEGREEAQSALIHALLRLLQDDVTLVGEAKQLWEKLKSGASVLKLGKAISKSLITMSPDIDGFVDAFEKESGRIAETMESFEHDLRKLMQLVSVDRIVVFIDDLDRCSTGKVIETFETIKLFLNTPTCTFVIGADADKIKHAVGEVYGVANDTQRQKDYLEKIVQIPFGIPAQDLRDIGCYVGMLIVGRHLNDVAWQQLSGDRRRFYEAGDLGGEFAKWVQEKQIAFDGGTGTVTGELSAVIPYIDVLARGLRGNPRQIKRFLNILSLRQQLGKANRLDTKPDLLVKFTVLEYVWDKFFTDLVSNVDVRSGKSELLGKLVEADGTNEAGDASETLLKKYIQVPGLVEFLKATPAINGETNLQPYLFLAQTSLGRSQSIGIVTIDESTKALILSIESTDPIAARSAATKAAQDPTLGAAVFKQVVNDLATAKEQASMVNMLSGLATIGKAQPELFKSAFSAIEKLDGNNQAISLSVSALITSAEKANIQVGKELKDKFKSNISEALTKSRTPGKR
jgi:hypothetical protein